MDNVLVDFQTGIACLQRPAKNSKVGWTKSRASSPWWIRSKGQWKAFMSWPSSLIPIFSQRRRGIIPARGTTNTCGWKNIWGRRRKNGWSSATTSIWTEGIFWSTTGQTRTAREIFRASCWHLTFAKHVITEQDEAYPSYLFLAALSPIRVRPAEWLARDCKSGLFQLVKKCVNKTTVVASTNKLICSNRSLARFECFYHGIFPGFVGWFQVWTSSNAPLA